MGGKFHIAGQISGLLRQLRQNEQPYLEPFVGGCNILQRVPSGTRVASDTNAYLITLYKALQAGWQPPTSMNKEEWQAIKDRMDPDDPVTAFAGFGSSFAGGWFQAYGTQDKRPGRNSCAFNSARTLLELVPHIADVDFRACDYREHVPVGALIYCDPPYRGTAGYRAVGRFDHDAFWQTMRDWSVDNTVLVSEYTAPADFVPVWQQRKTTGLRGSDGKGKRTIETVFMHESQARVFKVLGEQQDLI
jgi:DNA adenine methylase